MGLATSNWSAMQNTITVKRPKHVRQYERRPYAGRVQWLDGWPRECGALDISAGGVGLLSTDPVDVGQAVHLAFLGRSVRVRGFVTNVHPRKTGDWRVGISFLQDEPELAEVALAAG